MEATPRTRRTVRLRGYDYTRPGAYLITVCTAGRRHLFGAVRAGGMELNELGEIVRSEWFRGSDLRPYLLLPEDDLVIMPNHVHGIVHMLDRPGRRGSPEAFGKPVPGSISTILRAFKSISTRRIHALGGSTAAPVWQRGFHEHVLRNEQSLRLAREYIRENPARWALKGDGTGRSVPHPGEGTR